MEACHISSKEMIPIVMAAMVWGSQWEGLSVRFHTDNSAVVDSGSVKDESLMYLMRCFSFVSAKFNFVFSACHIQGKDNVLADALCLVGAALWAFYTAFQRRSTRYVTAITSYPVFRFF